METINLYFDMEFTSLSPDAQIISLGIVSDDLASNKRSDFERGVIDLKQYVESKEYATNSNVTSKSFYAEFTDFDINRCDDWVKENVVGKLRGVRDYGFKCYIENNFEQPKSSTVDIIIPELRQWLKQFSAYNIQFVCDCGTFDWYHMLQLLDERESAPCKLIINADALPKNMNIDDFVKEWKESPFVLYNVPHEVIKFHETGLPKLPANISPVPEDLNDLIALKKGITVREAFDLNREELIGGRQLRDNTDGNIMCDDGTLVLKNNALWDAKVIKLIYEKLMKEFD